MFVASACCGGCNPRGRVVRMCRAVVPHMTARGSGSILNVTAISMPRRWLWRWRHTTSTSITICPGYIDTQRLEKVFAAAGEDPAIMRRKLETEVPMGRIGTVDDVASLVALLASPRGRYITGTAIQVDGGLLRGVR